MAHRQSDLPRSWQSPDHPACTRRPAPTRPLMARNPLRPFPAWGSAPRTIPRQPGRRGFPISGPSGIPPGLPEDSSAYAGYFIPITLDHPRIPYARSRIHKAPSPARLWLRTTTYQGLLSLSTTNCALPPNEGKVHASSMRAGMATGPIMAGQPVHCLGRGGASLADRAIRTPGPLRSLPPQCLAIPRSCQEHLAQLGTQSVRQAICRRKPILPRLPRVSLRALPSLQSRSPHQVNLHACATRRWGEAFSTRASARAPSCRIRGERAASWTACRGLHRRDRNRANAGSTLH